MQVCGDCTNSAIVWCVCGLVAGWVSQELVEHVIEHCRAHFGAARSHDRPVRVLEVGCGSGAVSIALLKSLSTATVTAIDIDPRAIDVTNHNAERCVCQHRVRSIVAPMNCRMIEMCCVVGRGELDALSLQGVITVKIVLCARSVPARHTVSDSHCV